MQIIQKHLKDIIQATEDAFLWRNFDIKRNETVTVI